MSDNSVVAVAKGYAPIATGATGMFLDWLDVINSALSILLVLVGILGGFWLYRKNKAEALKAEAERIRIRLENDRMKIENDERMIAAESKKGVLQLVDILSQVLNDEKIKKHNHNQYDSHSNDWLHD